MQVLVDLEKLEGFGLSITDVSDAVTLNHIDFPIGSFRTDEYYYQTSLKGEFDTPEELLGISIISVNNQPIFLRDVANVREVFEETSIEAVAKDRPLGGNPFAGITHAFSSKFFSAIVVKSIIASLLGTALYMFAQLFDTEDRQ